jgi:hypothetical protein
VTVAVRVTLVPEMAEGGVGTTAVVVATRDSPQFTASKLASTDPSPVTKLYPVAGSALEAWNPMVPVVPVAPGHR